MRRGERKGQVTIFILLGIVIVIAFAIAVLARGVLVNDRIQREAETAVTNFIQANSITYYVESCLERVTIDAVQNISLHGGTYNFSGGTLGVNYTTYIHDGEELQVAYGLKANTRCPDIFPNAPSYPRPYTTLNTLSPAHYNSLCRTTPQDGYYGMFLLPYLCDMRGENSRFATNNLYYACESWNQGFYREQTLQGRLANRISQEMRSCVDFSIYKDLGHDITLKEEAIDTQVIYGFDQINIITTFPFEVTIQGSGPVVTKTDFTYSLPVRLHRMHHYITRLLAEDAQRHNFSIDNDYYKVDFYTPDFEVTYHKNACATPTVECANDNVLEVKDLAYKIENKSFTFLTAIKNRRPALDYIHQTTGNTQYDIQAIQNETIVLQPEGYDPDDEGVTYTYSRWKQDEDAEFDFTCANNLVVAANSGDIIDFSPCVIPLVNEPHNWTLSELYQNTNQYAEYNATPEDTGPHTVRITIFDEEGLIDYQDVRILVFDLPQAVPNGTSGFVGVRNDQASIEDPYLLDGSNSRASMISNQPISDYKWKGIDTVDPTITYWELLTQEQQTLLPNDSWPLPFADPLYTVFPSFPAPGQQDIWLQVTASNLHSIPTTFTLNVHECIPFRNTGTPLLEPHDNGYDITEFSYPYNNTPYNTYDHTCCQGTIDATEEVLGASIYQTSDAVICFHQTDYGTILGFTDQPLLSTNGNPSVPAPNPLTRSYTPSAAIAAATNTNSIYANDIFSREFTRNCDGTRGNICIGDVNEDLNRLIECEDDIGIPATQDERCQGPPTNTLTTVQPTQCHFYQYYDNGAQNTFEEAMGITTDLHGGTVDGICNPEPRCSSSHTYADGGGYQVAVGGCSGSSGNCTYPVRLQIQDLCSQNNYNLCETPNQNGDARNYQFIRAIHRCTTGSPDQCQLTGYLNLWGSGNNRCGNYPSFFDPTPPLGASYCDGSNTLPQTCGPNECCDNNDFSITRTKPCYDPCTESGSINDDCININNGINGRNCGANTCGLVTDHRDCTTNGNEGYCNTPGKTYTQGDPITGDGYCQPKLNNGNPCTGDFQCLSGNCDVIQETSRCVAA